MISNKEQYDLLSEIGDKISSDIHATHSYSRCEMGSNIHKGYLSNGSPIIIDDSWAYLKIEVPRYLIVETFNEDNIEYKMGGYKELLKIYKMLIDEGVFW
jgi:hypothetical protein